MPCNCNGMNCACWEQCRKKEKEKLLLKMQTEAEKLFADPTVTITKIEKQESKL